MCPPPAEPIRPIGPVAGGTYVDRAQLTERVHRRAPRDEDDRQDDDGRRRRRDPEDAAPVPAPAAVRDPRAYDDHGRRPGQDDAADLPHVDATA